MRNKSDKFDFMDIGVMEKYPFPEIGNDWFIFNCNNYYNWHSMAKNIRYIIGALVTGTALFDIITISLPTII